MVGILQGLSMDFRYSESESERMRLACGIQKDDWELARMFNAYDEVMKANEKGGKKEVMEVLKALQRKREGRNSPQL